MQHFQSILIVIGLIAIGGVLIHGYLVSRKDKEHISERGTNVDIFAENSSSESKDEDQVQDEVLGEVRIISLNDEQHEDDRIDFSVALDEDKSEPLAFSSSLDPEQKQSAQIKDEFETFDVSSPVEPTLSKDDPEFFAEETTPEFHGSGFFDEPVLEVAEEVTPELIIPNEEEVVSQPQDLFIFNVVAKEGEKLGGHELLQFFLTSGFRHGEMAIFHRHKNSDGTGPVLFSIANMMAPGVFDTENMEQFKSEGVSFFLSAPNSEIDIKKSFEMMLRAVEQMAEEFDCEVLNADREKMTTEQFIEYNNRLLHYI